MNIFIFFIINTNDVMLHKILEKVNLNNYKH